MTSEGCLLSAVRNAALVRRRGGGRKGLETVDNIMQLPTGATPRRYDSLYTLDALGRLTAQERGHLASGTITSAHELRDWSLSQTGNWLLRTIDYNGNSDLEDSGDGTSPVVPRDLDMTSATYNVANEWTARTDVTGNVPPGTPDTITDNYSMTYDLAGNMTSDGKEYNYRYDVFGRLLGIDTVSTDDPVKSYRYNGLGWRIVDDNGAAEHLVYNEKWQLLARYAGADVREQWLPHGAGLDGGGGSSYIDSVILRTTYTGTGGGVSEDKRFYFAQNWRADVSVVLDDAGVQQERVSYSPYGQPFGIAAGDTDFDGDHDATDDTAITGWNGALKPYRAYADVNLDGSINSSDATAADADSLGWDVLTSDDVLNRIGYAGYIHDRDVATAAHIRYRVYKIDLGRELLTRIGVVNLMQLRRVQASQLQRLDVLPRMARMAMN